MRLVYISNPLSLVIEHYEPISFEYDGWTVSEKYDYDEKHPTFSEYRLVISSKEIETKDILSKTALQGNEITKVTTKLLPFVSLVSLNEPVNTCTSRTRSVFAIGKPLKGWSNNYEEIESELSKDEKVKCTFMGTNNWAKIPKSPLEELKVMLENYKNLLDEYKFLIFLHNSIIESEDINRYMLIGKALEIINAVYPYEKKKGKPDSRITNFHPELLPIFREMTLENLICLSNNRRETIHYIYPKRNMISHPQLSEEEAEKLYICSVALITNVIRKQLGLEVLTIELE